MSRETLAQMLGALAQGAVLGALLVIAVIKLIEVATDAQLFRYQGF